MIRLYKCPCRKSDIQTYSIPIVSYMSYQHVLLPLLWKLLLPLPWGPPALLRLLLWLFLPQQPGLQHWPLLSQLLPSGILSLHWLSGDLLWSHQVPDIPCGVRSLPDVLLPPEDLHILHSLTDDLLCSLGLWALAPSNFQSFDCGFRSLGFGSSGFQSVGCGPNAFSSLSCRSSFYLLTYLSSRSCQSLSFQPTCGPGFY